MGKENKPKPILIVAQAQGLKNLAVEGGWRLSFDLFDSRLQDIQHATDIVNRKANVKLVIFEINEEKTEKKRSKKKKETEKATFFHGSNIGDLELSMENDN